MCGILRILCPVLNRVRLNLGNTRHRPNIDISGLPSSKECCEGRKAPFWNFLNGDIDGARITANATAGGQVIPIGIDAALAREFATGLSTSTIELGMVFEETLLWYAQREAGVRIGSAHFAFKLPVQSHEIDFALYHDDRARVVDGDWQRVIGQHSAAIFEMTCGHLSETSESQVYDGNDHPQKKLVNFLHLASLGFRHLSFDYLSILGFPTAGMSEATKHATRNTPGFAYWSLSDQFPDVERVVMDSIESPTLDIGTLRSWHNAIIERVTARGAEFAVKVRPVAGRV